MRCGDTGMQVGTFPVNGYEGVDRCIAEHLSIVGCSLCLEALAVEVEVLDLVCLGEAAVDQRHLDTNEVL